MLSSVSLLLIFTNAFAWYNEVLWSEPITATYIVMYRNQSKPTTDYISSLVSDDESINIKYIKKNRQSPYIPNILPGIFTSQSTWLIKMLSMKAHYLFSLQPIDMFPYFILSKLISQRYRHTILVLCRVSDTHTSTIHI